MSRYANSGPVGAYDAWLRTTPDDEAAASAAQQSRRDARAERAIDAIESPDGWQSPRYQTFADIRLPDGSLPPYKRSTHPDDYA